MGNLDFALIQNSACLEISRAPVQPRKCVLFSFELFLLRQLAVIVETMRNFGTPICAWRATVAGTAQTQAVRKGLATSTLQNNHLQCLF